MASEIKVDTISEKTSANGVTIDGVNIKDSALATAGSVPLSTIDIDGGTDIGAAIVDADLFIIDDGAGGTNRKTAASRLKTYIGGSDPASADGDTLGTASLEWSDLYLADSSVIYFGNDQDTTLTHTDGTGLTLNSTNKLCFNDASQFIQGASGTVLDIAATDEIELTATEVEMNVTTLDVNGNVDVSGTTLLPTLGVVTAKDLGNGIHIKISDAGAISGGLNTDGDDFVIEHSGSGGMSIITGTSSQGGIYFGDSGDADIGVVRYDHANDSMDFFTAGTERANITSNGLEVTNGIGVGSAKDLGVGLHIKTADSGASSVDANGDELVIENSGNTGLTILSGTSSTGTIYFGDSGSSNIGYVEYLHNGNSLDFGVTSTRMRIHSDGDISMGTTSSEGRLDVRYDANGVGLHLLNSKSSGCTSTTRVAVISGNQDSSGSYDLVHIRNGGGHVCNVADSGNIQNSGNSYGALSDNRIKQNITDASSQWDDIKALKIKNFKLKKLVNRDGNSAPSHLGVIAQDLETSSMNGLVEEISPTKEDVALSSDFGTLVDDTDKPILDEEGNPTGEYEQIFTEGQKVKAIKYSVLYMKAVKALQEAQTRIETLEAKVAVLEG